MVDAVLPRTVEQLLATAFMDGGDGDLVFELFERNRITHRQLDPRKQ